MLNAQDRPSAAAKPKILIVEDEGLIALDIETRVRKAGYDIAGIVDSGEAALEKVTEVNPDLILMDIRLSGSLDGIESARQVQQRCDVPVIYMTAHTDRDTVNRAKVTGPFGYIAKPISQSSLPTSIEIALYKHRMERELRQQRAWFKTTLKTMSDAVIVTDHLNRIQYLNPAAEHLTGWSAPDVLNLPLANVLKLVHPLHGNWFTDASASTQLDGVQRAFPHGLKLVAASGQQIPVEGEIASSADDFTSLGAVITFRDVTEREQQEQELRHDQKMEAVGRLAAGVAHDFNNLLTVVLGHAQLLLARKDAFDEPARESLQEINRAGTTAAAVTRQLLTYSRGQASEPRLVSLTEIVQDNAGLCRSLLGVNIQWKTALEPQLHPVYADPGQLVQVLVNLVVNAADAMPHGGTVMVSTENVETSRLAGADSDDTGDHVVLTVSDTGTGMDPAVAEHIFEPFFTTKSAGHGTGLGLSIVYSIVDHLAGVISVDSQPGAGSTFRVFIPVSNYKAGNLPAANPALRPVPGHRKTILLVDDNEAVRGLMQKYLEAAGYAVFPASDGADALALVKTLSTRIDLLVTDVVMPRMNGVSLAEQLTRLRPDLKTIFVSGYAGDILDNISPELAGARFLQKPFLDSDLTRQIQQLFDDGTAGDGSTGWLV